MYSNRGIMLTDSQKIEQVENALDGNSNDLFFEIILKRNNNNSVILKHTIDARNYVLWHAPTPDAATLGNGYLLTGYHFSPLTEKIKR